MGTIVSFEASRAKTHATLAGSAAVASDGADGDRVASLAAEYARISTLLRASAPRCSNSSLRETLEAMATNVAADVEFLHHLAMELQAGPVCA